MGKINDKIKKLIIADNVSGMSVRQLSKKYGVSTTAIHYHLKRADKHIERKLTQKQEENTQDVLAYLDSQRERKKKILELAFGAMEKKLENLDMFTSLKDVVTLYGIMIDKEYKACENDATSQAIREQQLEKLKQETILVKAKAEAVSKGGSALEILEGLRAMQNLMNTPVPERTIEDLEDEDTDTVQPETN